MSLIITTEKILSQLITFIEVISEDQFTKKIPQLSSASIGQHTRHIIEFFQCLLKGSQEGIINYDKRNRSIELEKNKDYTIFHLKQIMASLPYKDIEQELLLKCNYHLSSDEDISVKTIFGRELIYNIEHAVHHMAIIKIGASLIAEEILLPENFGVAASTLRYKNKNVHSNLSA